MAVAVCYEAPTKFVRYTVADGTGIAKGTLLKLSSPNTASAASADNDVVAGIAWMEKVADDGSTEIVAALDGVFGITSSAAIISIGEDVVISSANTIKKYTTLDREKGYVLGKSLETIGASATVTKIRVNVQ